MNTADEIIRRLGLVPHPEGGYFREMYRSRIVCPAESLPPDFDGNRSAGTSILCLLKGGDFSAFHRLRSDEIWHYHAGDPAILHMIHPDGRLETVNLGMRGDRIHTPLLVLPAGTWFAVRIDQDKGWMLASCTVIPGFDYNDFDLARRSDLIARFPAHAALIESLTRG